MAEQIHEYHYIGRTDDLDEFLCPECGRRVFIRWAPNFERIIKAAGDDLVMHSGSKGGLKMSPPAVMADDPFEAFISRLDIGRKLDDTGGE